MLLAGPLVAAVLPVESAPPLAVDPVLVPPELAPAGAWPIPGLLVAAVPPLGVLTGAVPEAGVDDGGPAGVDDGGPVGVFGLWPWPWPPGFVGWLVLPWLPGLVGFPGPCPGWTTVVQVVAEGNTVALVFGWPAEAVAAVHRPKSACELGPVVLLVEAVVFAGWPLDLPRVSA